jgi:hypothetical protein
MWNLIGNEKNYSIFQVDMIIKILVQLQLIVGQILILFIVYLFEIQIIVFDVLD